MSDPGLIFILHYFYDDARERIADVSEIIQHKTHKNMQQPLRPHPTYLPHSNVLYVRKYYGNV